MHTFFIYNLIQLWCESYVYWTVHHCVNWRIKDQLDVTCYFISLLMCSAWFTLIYPSSGACYYSVELQHWSYCSWFDMYWSFGVVGLEWYPCCRLQVIQQSSRKLLMMDILMYETCWAHKKWNKIASDIKLVFYSSTVNYIVFDMFRTTRCSSSGMHHF